MDYIPKQPHGQIISNDRYFTLRADTDGVGFVHCGDGVQIVPVTSDGHVLLAVEHSAAFDSDVLLLAGGSAKPGEPLEETANRELQEELGWRTGRIDFLGEIHPFKYLTSRQFIFLARDLSPSKLVGDELYPIVVRAVPLEGFIDLCSTAELQDGVAIAALFMARNFLKSEQSQ